MKTDLSGYPFTAIEFDKKGRFLDRDSSQLDTARSMIREKNITDIIIISHGWKNDVNAANDLYDEFFKNVRALETEGALPKLAGRTLGVIGIYWPAKQFGAAGDIGGAASTNDERAIIAAEVDAIADFSLIDNADIVAKRAKEQIPGLFHTDAARRSFVEAIRELIGDEDELETDSVLGRLDELEPHEQITQMPMIDDDGSDFQGGAAGLGDAIARKTQSLLNQFTYFMMKKRAGIVGKRSVADSVFTLNKDFPELRIHLVGHSFGGRLVTSTVNHLANFDHSVVDSLCLLQAAYSHNGLAKDFDGDRDGAFRSVLEKNGVKQHISITHTHADKAVTLAYALASRLSRVDASAVGDSEDRFGGMGANGAITRFTPEAAAGSMKAAPEAPVFSDKHVSNFLADDLITHHNDVTNRHVANLVIHTILKE